MKIKYDFKVGDLITAYHDGFHQIVEIFDRSNEKCAPLIVYRRILNSDGKSAGNMKKNDQCDAGFCQKIDAKFVQELYKKEIHAADLKHDQLLDLLYARENS